MPVIEFSGKTTEEAIEKACAQLHLAKDELRFEIISTGGGGLLSLLTGQKAVIKVTVEEPEAAEPVREELHAPKVRPTGESTFGLPSPRLKPPVAEDKKFRAERTGPKKPAPASSRKRSAQAVTTPEPARQEVIEPAGGVDAPTDPVAEKAGEVLRGLLSRMGIEADVTANINDTRIILMVQTENNGLLIGKKGVTLDALQFLLNKIINRSRNDRYRIIIDAGDYRQKRYEALVALANRMAEKARRTKRPISISALSAHDRRIIHMTLKGKAGFSTRSKGEGAFKRIVIVPDRVSDQATYTDASEIVEEFDDPGDF